MKKKVGVLGTGTMGHGIAEVCAVAGFDVIAYDIENAVLEKSAENIRKSLESLHSRRKLPLDPDKVMSSITFTTELSDIRDVDFLIEAVKEDLNVKCELLARASAYTKDTCIIATNTSTIPVSELAQSTAVPRNFVGLHFFNPPVIMPLIEIIKGEDTAAETMEAAAAFVKMLGKTYIRVMKDVPGFIVNRLNERLIRESMKILEEGVSPEVLDAMMRYRMVLPMGTCELLDFVGIDTVYLAGNELRKHGFESETSEILEEMFRKGKFGVKSGSGFYEYAGPGKYEKQQIVPSNGMYGISPHRIISVMVNEAAWLIRNGVASAEDIDRSMVLGMNWNEGPLRISDKVGLESTMKTLEEINRLTGLPRYTPDAFLKALVSEGKTGMKSGSGFFSWDITRKDFHSVKYTSVSGRAYITMGRPEKLNALDLDLWKGLYQAFTEAKNDPGTRMVILRGEGRSFSAGDDISMMKGWKNSEPEEWMKNFADPLVSIMLDYPKPVIAAVDGIAAGGGCELAMICDIVLASEKALFSVPEGRIGAMPPLASSLGTGQISRKLLRYALTGEPFSAETARELGMVDIVVAGDQIDSLLNEILDRIDRTAPGSLEAIKVTSNLARKVYSDSLIHGKNELVRLAGTEDFREGQRSFAEKRKPVWEGK